VRLGSEIVATYARARWTLRRTDLPTTLARLRSRSAGVRRNGGEAREESLRLARTTYRALARLPADSRCLMRSLVVTGMLERRGVPAKLVVAARVDGGFGAHAWVEVDGRALLDEADEPFKRLVEL